MMSYKHLWFFVVLLCGFRLTAAGNAEAWRSRTVYQLLTDRFATDQCWGTDAHNLDNYMGGTFSGMMKKVDYIEAMGFDAMWMSPYMLQGSDAFGMSGYAGYWPADFYQVNPAFGTAAELKELVKFYQDRGMFVLFDMVINHVGYGEWQTYSPFNQTTDFHDCNGCFTLNCAQDPAGMFASPPISGHSYEHCKLSGLPDLNHSDASVLQRMRDWEVWTVQQFKPDGLRYDAATNSLPSFVAALAEAASVWTIAELYLEDPLYDSDAYIAAWVRSNKTSSAFSFPMQKALRLSIRERNKDMIWLNGQRQSHLKLYGDKVHDMGGFIENHDMERWLDGGHNDYSRYKNGMAYILFMEGIPFIYYGAEHGFLEEREPLWYSSFKHNTHLWLFLKVSIYYRKLAKVWDSGIGKTVYNDTDTLVIARGEFVVALTSVGKSPGRPNGTVVSVTGLGKFAGKFLTNIYNPKEKLAVSKAGVGLFKASPDGEPQVFYAGSVVDPMSLYIPNKYWERERSAVFVLFLVLLLPTMLVTLIAMYFWSVRQLHPAAADDEDASRHTAGTVECDAAYRPRSNTSSYSSFATYLATPKGPSGRSASAKTPNRLMKALQRGFGLGAARVPGGRAASTSATAHNSINMQGLASEAAVRTSDHGRLRQLSMRQTLTAGSRPVLAQSPTSPAAADSKGTSVSSGEVPCSPERIEAFAGYTGVFRDAGKVSAVDLAQGLVLEEYAALQQKHAEGPPEISSRSSSSAVRPSSRTSATGLSPTGTRHSSFMFIHGRAGPLMSASAAGRASAETCPGAVATAVSSRSSSSHTVASPKADASEAASKVAADVPGAPLCCNGTGSIATGVSHDLKIDLSSQRTNSKTQKDAVSATGPACFQPSSTPIMHVALEYALPHLGFNNQLMFGGLGMVVNSFLKQWPGPLSLIAPLYKACYDEPPSSGNAEDGAAAAAAGDGILRPSFIPASQLPLLEMTVDVAGKQLPVEVFKVVTEENGHPRAYYLVQSDLFRHRLRGQIYTFEDEDEVLTWLAVFNQAVAAVVVQEGVTHMQLHDYHGGLSLLYLPERLRPATLYVAHNAHYDATFPIPTSERRNKVYEHLGLNAEQAAPYLEHNGAVDMLQAVVMYLRRMQQGRGVVAVSPRYAEQIADKLSVFWQLSALGRPRYITGILNCLDMSDSLAATDMTTEQVLNVKAQAKLKLQAMYRLAEGQQYTLCVFIGRVTHQKGCDIIAEAAPYIMEHHPNLQLVVVGPTGDATGAAASARLAQLSLRYPDRMYCPQDYYVAGDEKNMLLTATDFCFIPSRFEPCGLVDIEFGWNGGIMIGHDTGGLGKMPGVYFTAQASHLSHLARKLEAAVGKAMALSSSARADMVGQALAKRFPADEMMILYSQTWVQIDSSYRETLKAHTNRLRFLQDHAQFFANKWARNNKTAAQPAPGLTSAASLEAAAKAGAAAQVVGPLGGLLVAPMAAAGAGRMPACDLMLTSDQQLAEMGGSGSGSRRSTSCCPVWMHNFPAAQQMSNYLLVTLQYWGLGPGVLLSTYLLLQEIRAKVYGECGFQPNAHQQLQISANLFKVGLGNSFVPRIILLFALSVGAAPIWFWLAAHLRPANYIRIAAVLVAAAYVLVFISMNYTGLLGVALLPVGLLNLVGSPLLSMGFLGEDDVEVSEVGRKMLALSETTKYTLLCAGMLLAAVANHPLAHAVVTGVCCLVSVAMAVWFCHPMSLSKAYQHLALTYRSQFKLLKYLSCFWLTLVISTTDMLAFMLTGFLVITTTQNLATFASFQAVAFGCSVAAVLWNYKLLCSRAAELRLNAAMLGLAAMPFYEFIKAAVLMAFRNSSNTAALLGISAMIDIIMGGRSSVTGLAGFMTLPSREVVSIWQFTAIALGALCALLIMVAARAVTLAGSPTSSSVLVAIIAGLELLRVCCIALMSRRYHKENLSAP